MKEVVLGIDIGGTYTKFGIVTREGEMFFEQAIPSDQHEDIRQFISFLKKKVYENFDSDSYKITGIGIGAPNGNFYNGTIEYAPNLQWKGIIELTRLFEEEFNLPAILTNDANAAALGEMIYGGAKDMKDFIMITLGTGLGSGIVVNGNMVYGHDGFAGELGHTNVSVEGRQCACGKKGCLETYVSATGIVRTVFELMGTEIEDSVLRNYKYEDLNSKMISDAANQGDPLALKAFDFTGRILGLKLADAVAYTSPEAFFLFGGLAAAGNLIFDPARKYMENYLLPIYKNKVKILPSALQDRNIAVLGAAALFIKEKA